MYDINVNCKEWCTEVAAKVNKTVNIALCCSQFLENATRDNAILKVIVWNLLGCNI